MARARVCPNPSMLVFNAKLAPPLPPTVSIRPLRKKKTADTIEKTETETETEIGAR